MKKASMFAALGAAGLMVAPVSAGMITTFEITLDGFQEVDSEGNPGQGDLEAFGAGEVSFDPSTEGDGEALVSYSIGYLNLQGVSTNADITGFHIHNAPAGANGPIVIDLGPGVDPSGEGLLMGQVMADAGIVQNILDNPSQYYVNVHTQAFPPGAIRGQLPAPGAAVPFGLAGLAMLRRRR